MKKNTFVKIIMLTGAVTLLNAMAAFAGTWQKEDNSWIYRNDNGQYVEYEWIQDGGAWYYVGRFGVMKRNEQVDGYYIGADGKMISEQDTENPIRKEDIYGACYIKVKSYQDSGNYYQAKVTLYDSSFGSTEMLSSYSVGDKFWIDSEKANGTVTRVNFSTGGDVSLEVKLGKVTYLFDPQVTIASDGEGEWDVVRMVDDNVEIKIPKNISILPDDTYPYSGNFRISLTDFLNAGVYKAIPVFEGNTVVKLYDTFSNYAS